MSIYRAEILYILQLLLFGDAVSYIPFSIAEEAAQALAATVTVDTTNYSISFNEFLRFISQQQEMEPDEDTLVDVFA